MENETKFADPENYSGNFGKDQLNFKFIVLQHLKKIGEYASVEMRGGYWEEKMRFAGGMGIPEKYYVPDSREVYSNAVDYFTDILFAHFDKEMEEKQEEIDKELEECYKLIFNNEKYKKNSYEWKQRSYRIDKVDIKRKLFRSLCSFLYRKKYLELGTIED